MKKFLCNNIVSGMQTSLAFIERISMDVVSHPELSAAGMVARMSQSPRFVDDEFDETFIAP